MLDINIIRTQPDLVKQAVANRQSPELAATVDEALAVDARRRELLKEVEALKAERNAVSKEIGRMKDAAAREARDKSREATSLSYLSIIHVFWGRYHDGLKYGAAAIALAEEIGDRRRIAFTTNFMTRALVSRGQWGEAVRLLEENLPFVQEVARVHVPWALFYLGILYHELWDVKRANKVLGPVQEVEAYHPSWREAILLSRLYLARLNHDTDALNRTLDEILRLPYGVFIPDDAEAMLPVGEALLESGRIDDLRRYVPARRPGIELFGAASHLAGLAIIEAQLSLRQGDTKSAGDLLDTAVKHAQTSEDVITTRRALELRLGLLGRVPLRRDPPL